MQKIRRRKRQNQAAKVCFFCRLALFGRTAAFLWPATFRILRLFATISTTLRPYSEPRSLLRRSQLALRR